jgi:hypothetical protein
MKTIKIEMRDLYGNRVFYPACENAKAFATIAKSKTLTQDTLQKIKALGYDIQVTLPDMEF